MPAQRGPKTWLALGLLLLCLGAAGAALAGITRLENPMANPTPRQELPADLHFDRLVVDKHTRLLTAYAQGEAVRQYRIALGWAPEGHKQVEGDGKTPEGTYFVDGKNPNSRYYKNLGVSYPNAEDQTAAAALDASPGGDIKIHGLPNGYGNIGAAHLLRDWTHGCIALTNAEMDELFRAVVHNAEIDIRP